MGDVVHAIRRLRASPTFTIAATLTLAIAIGATTSVFGLVDGVILKAFPYRNPDEILVMWENNPDLHLPHFAVSPADFVAWRAQTTTFTALAASSPPHAPLSYETESTVSGSGEPQRIKALAVTPNYFSTLGIAPILGRSLATDSMGSAEVVISQSYWEGQFGSAPSVVGRRLTIDDQPHIIVGVMPTGLLASPPGVPPVAPDLWTRLSFTGAYGPSHLHFLTAYGRLKAGATVAGARGELETIAARLAVANPEENKGFSVLVHPLLYDLVGDVRPALLMLLAAAACVLLIGAANIANLFLVRYLARERELAIRTALGATRTRVARELLVEAATLGLGAGAIGVGLAILGVRMLRVLAPPTLPRLSAIGIDQRVVIFCTLTSIATVLIFGVLPAWQTSQDQLADVIKEGGRGTGSAQRHRLQDGFVVLQVAVALILLTGAGLLVESFEHFARLDPGFRPEGVLTAQLALPKERYLTPQRRAALISQAVGALAAQPGVMAASAADYVPGVPGPAWGFTIVGDPTPDPTRWPLAATFGVTSDFFRTMGMRLLRGRELLPSDDSRAVQVVVVDDFLARRFFPSRDPIGRRLAFGRDTATIVGVVAPVAQLGLVQPAQPAVYASLVQSPSRIVYVAVRTTGDPLLHTGALKRAVSDLDPAVAVSDVETMSQRMAASVAASRFESVLAGLFAIIALALGMVGIYSVLAYVVTQRRREIAVRIALGASRSHVMNSVLVRAARLTGIGLILGSGMAWVLSRILANLFTGVNPHDPTIFISALVAFALVALTAASIPAFRTTRVNPVVALAST